jgi:hypothetical protein
LAIQFSGLALAAAVMSTRLATQTSGARSTLASCALLFAAIAAHPAVRARDARFSRFSTAAGYGERSP